MLPLKRPGGRLDPLGADNVENEVVVIPGRALQPVRKSDELFLQWMTDESSQEYLSSILKSTPEFSMRTRHTAAAVPGLVESEADVTKLPVYPIIHELTKASADSINLDSEAVRTIFKEQVVGGGLTSLCLHLCNLCAVPPVMCHSLARCIGPHFSSTPELFEEFWKHFFHKTDLAVRFYRLYVKSNQDLDIAVLRNFVKDCIQFIKPLKSVITGDQIFGAAYVRTCAVRLVFELLPRKGQYVQVGHLRRPRGAAFLECLASLSETTPLDQLPEFLSLTFVEKQTASFALMRPMSGSVVASEFGVVYGRRFHLRFLQSAHMLIRAPHTRPKGIAEKSKSSGSYTFEDFVWLNLILEDMTRKRSSRILFKCIDSDRDGLLSRSDLALCYDAQIFRMEQQSVKVIPFSDVMNLIITACRPLKPNAITYTEVCRAPEKVLRSLIDLEYLRSQMLGDWS
eukprot:TRINITY_DN3050_c2_g1_i1.p1 TRINITY_DN3050_c2_g1~~TRINITY_DN3050_c2_g1_i1.p1  ORF type:complete len:455 (-),score=46.53 TRINITY_DN3050_c2_g1_i1:150-1514(-)